MSRTDIGPRPVATERSLDLGRPLVAERLLGTERLLDTERSLGTERPVARQDADRTSAASVAAARRRSRRALRATPHGIFASLAVRNYRWFFFGMLLSNIGLWMFRVAQDWLVLTQLTQHSSLALGTITGLQFLPILLLSAYGGAVADRFDQRKLLMVTQTAAGLVALVQAALVLTGTVQLWHVYVLATLGGVVASFDNPARQAFVSELVPEPYLVNAVGLNATTFNASRLLGPGLAGLMIGVWGVGPAILVNAISYAATLVALVVMDPADLHRSPKTRGRGSVRAGLAYVWRRPDILLVMFMVFMLGTFGLNFQVTNALMATQVFRVGPEQYGLMGTVMGVGTLGAALMAASRKEPRMVVLVGALGGFTLGMVGLTVAPSYLVYIAVLILVGLTSLTVMTSANATVQLSVDPAMRGRVMALYMMVFMGGTPIGAPLIGWVGAQFGARATLGVGAVATGLATLAAVWVLVRARRGAPGPDEVAPGAADRGTMAA
ncbi:MFS transporter [Raineyella sp. W15-4]|uniref:MFS transporter n=1 Tax=Raineyella sp. W15-4 TaxID=3081651 RepID=UPI0029553A1E|nr:MFS transporter [Raineyella sp. W15-4]WOQ16596.1 MFS transporter [Raineyella sp. W15-4]